MIFGRRGRGGELRGEGVFLIWFFFVKGGFLGLVVNEVDFYVLLQIEYEKDGRQLGMRIGIRDLMLNERCK